LTKSQTFGPDWPELGHIRAKFASKRGEKVVLKSQEWYYIVSVHKYYRLTYFLVLIGMFDQKSKFLSDWLELGLIRQIRPKWAENIVFKSVIVLQSFYV